MRSRFALSLAPILILAVTHRSEAAVSKHESQAARPHRSLANATRHGATRVAYAHGHHVRVRHLALHHVKGRHIAYGKRSHGFTDPDGWNPVVADISYPNGVKQIGASVQLTSYEAGPAPSASEAVALSSGTPIESGVASYYGGRHNGRRTASGTIFNEHELTAAHAYLPFGTKVRVAVAGTDHFVIVTITDRLYARHRIIDLSEGAASQLGILRSGLAMVTLTPVP